MPEFPRSRVGLVQELATRILDVRPVGTDRETVARDLLGGFFDICVRCGLDKLLTELADPSEALDLDDRYMLADQPARLVAVAEKLALIDEGGPRNAKPRLMAEAVVDGLGLTLGDAPDRAITLPGGVQVEVMAALSSVIDAQLAVPQIRDSIIAKARALCDAHYLGSFDKITAQLDANAMRMIKQPKVPLDAMQAVQRMLNDARDTVIGGAASMAIDRAKPIIEKANADAAARIDRPITHQLTPREVAIKRACDAKTPKTPVAITRTVFDALSELSDIKWQAAEKPVRPYAASQTFAVGEVIEHPKFGRGTVMTAALQRIEVEFADGRHTLVHVGRK